MDSAFSRCLRLFHGVEDAHKSDAACEALPLEGSPLYVRALALLVAYASANLLAGHASSRWQQQWGLRQQAWHHADTVNRSATINFTALLHTVEAAAHAAATSTAADAAPACIQAWQAVAVPLLRAWKRCCVQSAAARTT